MKKLISVIMLVLVVVSLAACSADNSPNTPSAIGNKDRAEKFEKDVNKVEEKSGKGILANDAALGNVLTGTAVVRVLEFSGDDKPEMYVAYSDGTKPYANKQQIYGFDNGPYEFFSERKGNLELSEITSKSSADAKAPCIWLYTDESGISYLVIGEDLSKEAHYYSYVTVNPDGSEVYNIVEKFTGLNGKVYEGTYEKIELAGITQDEANAIFAKNEEALKLIEAGKN